MKDVEFLKSNNVDIDKSLEIFGDISTYNDSLGEFLIGIEDKIKKLSQYKSKSDMQNYAIYVHSLKSDAKYFGFTTLGDMAYEHEMKSKAGDTYYVNENFEALEAEVMKTKKIVKAYMSDDDSDVASDTSSSESAETSKETAVAPVNNAPIYEKETILVVDDSNIVRNFVKRIFSDRYDVGTAENGQEAIDVISANKDNNMIVTILLDLNMPKVGGFKVLDYMKDNDLFQKSPVSIISGDSSKETIDRAFTYDIIDMIGKPFNADDIKSVVEKNLYYRDMNN